MSATTRAAHIDAGGIMLDGDLAVPRGASGIVVFAHGSGSSRHSSRNQLVARALQELGFATLLLDLLTADEDPIDQQTRHLRFDVDLLAGRLSAAAAWLGNSSDLSGLPIGYFGASTGAAAALMAAADRPDVRAVVSRGGRPDLAGDHLSRVVAPTLLIVGGRDEAVLELNELASARLGGRRRLEVVAGATHLFEEPGALEKVASLAGDWFAAHLAGSAAGGARA